MRQRLGAAAAVIYDACGRSETAQPLGPLIALGAMPDAGLIGSHGGNVKTRGRVEGRFSLCVPGQLYRRDPSRPRFIDQRRIISRHQGPCHGR